MDGSISRKGYSKEEVSIHNSEGDCWVIVHGNVYNVTDFLHHHPGGAAALSKAGRGGLDVTEHFERIGHSEKARNILKSLQIGVLETVVTENSGRINESQEIDMDKADESDFLLGSASIVGGEDDKEHSVMWHAARRNAILKDHPEIAQLMGSNPFTVFIGLATVIIHSYMCLYVQQAEVTWYATLFFAYTIGAMCKMYQFAVNHDLCHGTAGSIFEYSSLLKRSAMQILTLPSIGGAMHTYYEFQHLGHHSALGSQAVADLQEFGRTKSSDGKIDYVTLRKLPFFPDGDGDLLAIGNFSYGRILDKWGVRQGKHIITPRSYYGWSDDPSKRQMAIQMALFHRSAWLKCLVVQVGHIVHHAALAMLLLSALLLPPPINLFGFIFAESGVALFIRVLQYMKIFDKLHFTPQAFQLILTTIVQGGCSVSLHAWLWVLYSIYLLFWHDHVTVYSVVKGFLYLYLSDLCLYGFGMHPYMGYFLGVHRSGGKGFETKESPVLKTNECQPTMSTYSCWDAFISMNLTHHVEHHDFPSIPWNNLPKVTRIAPEYYDGLEHSPGFLHTIYRWIQHSEGWGYACQ